MTVQELIDELQNYPKDMMVVVAGLEGGLNYLSELFPVKVKEIAGRRQDYYGFTHSLCKEGGVTTLKLE